MAARASLFFIVILLAKPVAFEFHSRFVIWNVGQGLWTTWIDDVGCWHFDMGGEHAPWAKIMRLCRPEKNFVHLSHWDSDHISFVGRASMFLPSLCRLNLPARAVSEKKLRMVERVQKCAFKGPFAEWIPEVQRTSNDASSVVEWNRILVPGDSTKAAEKDWMRALRLESVEVLVLGHHGSQTSTSARLLARMPRLKVAVASARRKRYGHPHEEVRRLLKQNSVPLLSTEDWGNIHIWL